MGTFIAITQPHFSVDYYFWRNCLIKRFFPAYVFDLRICLFTSQCCRPLIALDPCEAAARREDVVELQKAVANMPHPLKTALLLHYYEDMSYKDIATTLGCSPRGVETRLYRARAWLCKKLGVASREKNPKKPTASKSPHSSDCEPCRPEMAQASISTSSGEIGCSVTTRSSVPLHTWQQKIVLSLLLQLDLKREYFDYYRRGYR